MGLWWVMNGIGLVVVAPLVIFLANRIIRSGREIVAYADDILEHGVGITAALDPVPALITTRDEVTQVTNHAVRYVTALRQLV